MGLEAICVLVMGACFVCVVIAVARPRKERKPIPTDKEEAHFVTICPHCGGNAKVDVVWHYDEPHPLQFTFTKVKE